MGTEGLHNLRGGAPGVARHPRQEASTRLLPLNNQTTRPLLKVQPPFFYLQIDLPVLRDMWDLVLLQVFAIRENSLLEKPAMSCLNILPGVAQERPDFQRIIQNRSSARQV